MPPPTSNIELGNSLFVSATAAIGGGMRGRLDRPFASIEAAIEAALDGDAVFLYPGLYTPVNTISINKNICIQSLGISRIYSPNLTPISVWGGSVVFRDCSIRTDATSNQDVILLGGTKTNLLLDRCDIYAGGGAAGTDAIGMDNGNLTLRNCTVVSEGANGLTLRASGKSSLSNCNIAGMDSALVVDDTLLIESDGCNFHCNGLSGAVQTAGHGSPQVHLRAGRVTSIAGGLDFAVRSGEITVAGTVWDRAKGMPTREWIPGAGWK